MDPDAVARAFVEHYYSTFDANRAGLANLYQDGSMLTFEGQKIQGSQNIVAKLTGLPFQQCKHNITTVDCQPSGPAGGMLVFVSGSLQLAGEQHALKFSQVSFLYIICTFVSTSLMSFSPKLYLLRYVWLWWQSWITFIGVLGFLVCLDWSAIGWSWNCRFSNDFRLCFVDLFHMWMLPVCFGCRFGAHRGWWIRDYCQFVLICGSAGGIMVFILDMLCHAFGRSRAQYMLVAFIFPFFFSQSEDVLLIFV